MSLNLAVKEDGPLVPCRPLKKKRILYLSTVASPSPWTGTGGACVHEGRERLFVSEGVQTKHTKSRRKKENERHRPRVAHEARCVLSAFAGGSPPGGSPR